MISPLDMWALTYRAPFSGDVTQRIAPQVLSPAIKGSPAIEDKVVTEVASYGKQLGKILEALQILAKASDVDLPEIDALTRDVEAVKLSVKEQLRDEAEAALRRLKEVDKGAWDALRRAD